MIDVNLSYSLVDNNKSEYKTEFEAKLRSVLQKFQFENLGFKNLPYSYETLKVELDKARSLAGGMNTIVVIGIGGSDLGARALHTALNGQYFNEKSPKKFYFAGDTTDPEMLSELIPLLNLKTTLFLVISKSGNTIEQASTFIYLKNLIIQSLGEDQLTKHFVFITDSSSGSLKELSNLNGYQTITIPSDVGGRFSVLSSVGMVPAYLAGLNVKEFLNGAKELDQYIQSNYESNIVSNYIKSQYLNYQNGIQISVIMPYQYLLSDFSKWYVQLFAESLGKEGKGITPIGALGPTDQHSQLQLYNDGPNDKFFTFLLAKESRNDLFLPDVVDNQFDYLKSKSLHQILRYELQTTMYSLVSRQRPLSIITIPKINEFYMGQLFYFFEVAVTYFGYLLDINPFDQPGVELSKNAMYGILGRKGYEEEKNRFLDFINFTEDFQL